MFSHAYHGRISLSNLPQPGNIGASDYLGTIILIGMIVAIPTILAGYLWATKVANKIEIEGEDELDLDYDEIVKSFGELPSTFKSFAPIVLPILMIGTGSSRQLLSMGRRSSGGSIIHRFTGRSLTDWCPGCVCPYAQMG